MEKSGSNVPAKVGMLLQTKKQRMDIGGLPDLWKTCHIPNKSLAKEMKLPWLV